MPPLKRIIIFPKAISSIGQLVSSDLKLETGGILLGKYDASDTCSIQLATGPGPHAPRTPSTVDFEVEFLQQKQDRLMAEDPSIRFLGDWHYHTKGWGRPSRTDRERLSELLTDPDYMLGDRAIIVIAICWGSRLKLKGFSLSKQKRIVRIPTRLSDSLEKNSGQAPA